MTRNYKKYNDADIIKYVKVATSMAQLLSELNLRPTGGNYDNMKKNLQRLKLDCKHWRGQTWNKEQRTKNWSEYTKAASIKPHLEKQRGHRCERCGRKEWENEPIPLEIDHKNGDKTDNHYENLRLLCCNCHALTPTWKNKRRGSPIGRRHHSQNVDSVGSNPSLGT